MCSLSIFVKNFASLCAGALMLKITGRIGASGLYNFIRAFRLGASGLFCERYLICFLLMIKLQCLRLSIMFFGTEWWGLS